MGWSRHDYPYKSGNNGDSGECLANDTKAAYTIGAYMYISRDGRIPSVVDYVETADKKLATQLRATPIAVSINADKLQTYQDGIIMAGEGDDACSHSLDHAVLLIGTNAINMEDSIGTPYWIIRNSWGEDWGMDGAFYMERGKNTCGVEIFTTIPTGVARTEARAGFKQVGEKLCDANERCFVVACGASRTFGHCLAYAAVPLAPA